MGKLEGESCLANTGGPGERRQDGDRANLEAGRLEGGADFPDDRPESQHQCRLLGAGAGQQAEPRPTRTVPDDQAREGHHHGPKKIARGGVNPAGVARSAAHAAVSFPFKRVNGRRTACGDEADYEGMHAPRLTSSGANTVQQCGQVVRRNSVRGRALIGRPFHP